MSKILFVGDPHLNYQTPQSRKDIYPQTILDKIVKIGDIARQLNVDDIIFLGDIFHQRYQPYNYIMRCYKAFKSLPVTPYTIIGNHDIVFEREDSFEESPLNFLVLTGAMKRLSDSSLRYDNDTVNIVGYDYFQPICQIASGAYTVCVAHQYYNTPLFKTFITPEQAYNLGYNAYVLGHDHSVYEDVVNDKYKLIRSGSLSRGTSHASNLVRDVYVTLFDTVTKEFTRITVPTDKAEDVFKEIKFVEKSLEANVDDIIEKLEFNAGDSIYDMLDREDVPEDIRSLIITYLEQNGIFRKLNKTE